MSVPDAAAERLHNPYVDELLQSLRPPVHPLVNARQTQALIRRARDGGSRPVRRAGRNDLDLVGPAPGRQSVDNGLRPAVPDAARDGPSDEGRLVRPGRHRRHDHLPRRRQRRRQRAGDHQEWWPGGAWSRLVIGNHDQDREALREAGSRRSTPCAVGNRPTRRWL